MSKPKHKLVLVIDADFFVYSSAASCSRVIEWEDGILESWADLNDGIACFERYLEGIRSLRKGWEDAHLVMAFTDTVNWRKSVFPDYKRARGSKPLAYWKLKEHVEKHYDSFQRPTLEGDDVCGILMTAPSLVDAERVVAVSPDKDFNTVPGEFLWYDSYSKRHEYKVITQKEADWWHMLQTLMGDTTDGYSGCPGIGKDTAIAFLENPYIAYQKERILKSGPRKGEVELQWSTRALEEGETLWDAIVSLFEKAGQTEAEALVQARVARICRAEDFDFKSKQVILWEPPAKE